MIQSQASIPFALKDGELLRFFAWFMEEECRLLIIGHHLAGDGMSFACLTRDIMTALAGKRSRTVPYSCIRSLDRKQRKAESASEVPDEAA